MTRSSKEPRTIRIRDERSGAVVRVLSKAEDGSSFSSPFEIALSEDGKCVFAICEHDAVRCIDIDSAAVRWERVFNFDKGERWTRVFNCWHLSIGGRSTVAVNVPGMAVEGSEKVDASEILLLDGTTGRDIGRIDLPTLGLYAFAHAPRRGVIAGRTQQGRVLVWSDTSLELLASVEAPAIEESLQLLFSPDETQLIAIDRRGSLHRISADTWQLEASNPAVHLLPHCASYSPNGDALLVDGEDQVLLFDPITLESRGRIKGDGGVLNPVFDSNGNLMLTRADGKHWLSWLLSNRQDLRSDTLLGR